MEDDGFHPIDDSVVFEQVKIEDVTEDVAVVTDVPSQQSDIDGEISAEIRKMTQKHFESKPDPIAVFERRYAQVDKLTKSYLDETTYQLSLRRAEFVREIAEATAGIPPQSDDPAERARDAIIPGYHDVESTWLLRMAALLYNLPTRVPLQALLNRLVQDIVYMDADIMLYLCKHAYAEPEDLTMYLLAARILADGQTLAIGGAPHHLCTRPAIDIYKRLHPDSGEQSPRTNDATNSTTPTVETPTAQPESV